MKVENAMYVMKKHVGTYDYVSWQGRDGILREMEGDYQRTLFRGGAEVKRHSRVQ